MLSFSFQQASALLLFNSSDRTSYSEIMTQLNLTGDYADLDVKEIKKRIEDLIYRDYLERDKDNANLS
ncbi:cullin-1, partial [Trifolium medium]|nr:cullin-1 [Trifolium medium]